MGERVYASFRPSGQSGLNSCPLPHISLHFSNSPLLDLSLGRSDIQTVGCCRHRADRPRAGFPSGAEGCSVVSAFAETLQLDSRFTGIERHCAGILKVTRGKTWTRHLRYIERSAASQHCRFVAGKIGQDDLVHPGRGWEAIG